jgi:eukaryotic-like serine/threonine-protein kinase
MGCRGEDSLKFWLHLWFGSGFNVSQSNAPDETISVVVRKSMFRCACGHDVEVVDGKGKCGNCNRNVSLAGLDASQTLSFTSNGSDDSNIHSLLSQGCDRSDERLGHFRLISMLGQGGMGVVYRALDESLQRFVAVKVMRCTSAEGSSTARVTRLLDEAVAQARLNHPHVVTIYYVGRDDVDPFFAMELLPGPTLDKVLADGPLPYPRVIRFARQISSALSQATKMNLVHGDIKPSNLILANPETVKLGDFGLAQTDKKSTIGISGTLNYMAPELAEGAAPTAQSDMYALGITLFELTFGRRPFSLSGQTITDQLNSRRDANIEFPEKWPPSVPERWRNVLERLLAKDPKNRYASFEEFDAALQAIAPVGVTKAGRLNRLLALLIDLTLQFVIMVPLAIPGLFALASFENIEDEILRFWVRNGFAMLSLLTLLIPAAMAWIEWNGWRTPGRYLFQLRVVDSHGLKLSRRKRVLRGVIRNASIWCAGISFCCLSFELSAFIGMLWAIDCFVFLINGIAILGPSRLALQDRLVGSHVVLDTVGHTNFSYH